jgi:AcrR family transcriptional regulator
MTPAADEIPAPDAPRRILDAAIAVIDESGDASLRVVDIADAAGVAPGLINHHFGSRDGLVAAAQAERYTMSIGRDFSRFRAILGSDLPIDEVREQFREALSDVARRNRAENRLRRATALAATHGRPELRARLSETVADTIDGAAFVVALGQEKGLVRPELDPRATGTVMLCMALGYVLADFDSRPASEDDLTDVVGKMVDGVFLLPRGGSDLGSS